MTSNSSIVVSDYCRSQLREHARVDTVMSGMDLDRQFLTVWVNLNLDSGSQGMGGLCLDEVTYPACERELCALFGVETLQLIVGRDCFALRSFARIQQSIEGLEVDGRRWTVTGFFKRHGGVKAGYLSKLQIERESHLFEIRHHTRRIQEEASELARSESEYIDWEDPKAGEHPLLLGVHSK